MYFMGNAPINVKPAGGRRGIGRNFDIFQKFAVKFPIPGQKCEVMNRISHKLNTVQLLYIENGTMMGDGHFIAGWYPGVGIHWIFVTTGSRGGGSCPA